MDNSIDIYKELNHIVTSEQMALAFEDETEKAKQEKHVIF